jgi:hypothetical protein
VELPVLPEDKLVVAAEFPVVAPKVSVFKVELGDINGEARMVELVERVDFGFGGTMTHPFPVREQTEEVAVAGKHYEIGIEEEIMLQIMG